MIEKIAQLLVNMIGFADIILQKVQAAFGKTPISLFDQENAKKINSPDSPACGRHSGDPVHVNPSG